ncbi:CocE/NonD family hydrolase [Bifidobacterium avesanii]|nr:CocE/NonD family hydrolase [Bifidobacterium avesanii]KAB8290613.1 x-prolyl-dipeptidyl aminopeptidase [Bifidobacterium avesanii]
MAQETFRIGADGTSGELFSFEDAIRQFVYVEMPFDGDGDGGNDLIRVDIIRPRELDGDGQVPVIMEPSPYYGLYPRHGERKTYLHDDDKWNSPLVTFPLFYGNYFVPRGYAVLLTESSGTALSQGFCDIGGRRDIASVTAVVDWLNGRANAYWTRDDRSEANRATAYWATGAVGMLGQSYDGTLPIGAAATGVEGLKTIVPISAISSQYDWYHPFGCLLDGDDADGGWYEPYNFAEVLQSTANGLLQRFEVAPNGYKELKAGSDKEHRCYNDFWRERNYRLTMDKFKASVFIVHGTNDLNVMTNQVEPFWKLLGEAGVPRKMWLHQYAHDDPFDFRRDAWVETIHRWFDRWLLDVDNGIDREPAVSVTDPDDVWRDYASWPVPGTEEHEWGLRADAEGAGAVLGEAAPGKAAPGEAGAAASAATFHFKGARVKEFVPRGESAKPHDDRLLAVSAPLERDMHLSGAPSLRLRVRLAATGLGAAAVTELDTNLAASLIEYGEGNYPEPDADLHVMTEMADRTSTFGQSAPQDKATYKLKFPRRAYEVEHVVTRGWIALAHRNSFERFEPAPVGEWLDVEVPLLACDWTVRAGHRLALQVANTTTRLAKVDLADFDVDAASVRLTLPYC